MKNIIIVSLFLFAFNFNSNAQVHKHTLGLRTTGANPFRDLTVNYQLGLSKADRLDFGINLFGGFSPTSSQIGGFGSVYYNHVWNIKGGFNWFVGFGVNYAAAFINQVDGQQSFANNLGFGPQTGLEYDFNVLNVPLLIAVDIRPNLTYNFNSKFNYNPANRVGVSLRYTFK